MKKREGGENGWVIEMKQERSLEVEFNLMIRWQRRCLVLLSLRMIS